MVCRSPSCVGVMPHMTISAALALAAYAGSKGGEREIQLHCQRCGRTTTYSYDDVLSLLPPERRPHHLPPGFVLAIALLPIASPQQSHEDFYLGERLLVELTGEGPDEWLGLLRSQSGLSPSLDLESVVGGGFLNGLPVIYGHIIDAKAFPLPFAEPGPGTLDTGLFCAAHGDLATLRSANLFCTNPSCPHIFGPYFSQAKAIIEQQRGTGARPSSDGIALISCERCGMTRVLSMESYDDLYKV